MMTNPQGLQVSKNLLIAALSAVLFLSLLVVARPAYAASVQIVNYQEKAASDGDQVWAQGGWMMREGDAFYWYGLDVSAPSRLPDGVTPNPNAKKKVSAYTSTDLVNWTAHREVVDFQSINEYRQETGDTSIPAFTDGSWFGRPVVYHNDTIDKYVMFMEWGCCGKRNSFSIWYSDSPVGPFEYETVLVNPSNTYGQGDLGSVFTDDDGQTYLSYTVDLTWNSSENKPHYNSGIQIAKVTTTLNETTNEYDIDLEVVETLASAGPFKEATTVFKKGDTYYMLASQTNGWESSRTFYYTAPAIDGPWTSAYWISTTSWNGGFNGSPTPGAGNSFDTQIDQILPIHGTEGTFYLYIGDRWNNMPNKNSQDDPAIRATTGKGRNPFYPLTFDSAGKPILHGYEKWHLNLAAGTWSSTAPSAPAAVDTMLTYALVNGNSDKALGIVGHLTTSDASVEQRPYTGAPSQSWKFEDAGSGYYRIKNTNSGLYLDIKNASTADGGQVVQWTAGSANSQQWQLVDAGSGYYNIKNRNSGKLLGISAGSTGDGAPVIQWAATGSANQKWRFNAVAPVDLTRTYSITNGNSGKALGTVGNATASGTKIEQRPYSGTESQSWQFEYANGYYKIKNVNSGKYMDIDNETTAEGADSVISPASASNSQLWQLVDAGGGQYSLKNVKSGKMLGFSGGSTADGAVNKQWTASGSANQKWSIALLNLFLELGEH